MQRYILKLIITIISISAVSIAAWSFDQNHVKWNSVTSSYLTKQGLFQYKKLKEDLAANPKHDFNQYLEEIQKLKFKDYQEFNKDQKMAFLINAYNALTVKLIIDHYPVKSIKDIGWFGKAWKLEFFSLLDGKIKSLNPIEHEWLRPFSKDYRVHSAVNCASISCPQLRAEAYTANKLSKQLDEQMTLWLADTTRNEIEVSKKELVVSKIFDWYKADFKDWGPGVQGVFNKYGPKNSKDKIDDSFTIKYLNYDWDLNEAK